eukprot:scaffold3786_cov204-Alexandrium_tamarense.AAC.26
MTITEREGGSMTPSGHPTVLTSASEPCEPSASREVVVTQQVEAPAPAAGRGASYTKRDAMKAGKNGDAADGYSPDELTRASRHPPLDTGTTPSPPSSRPGAYSVENGNVERQSSVGADDFAAAVFWIPGDNIFTPSDTHITTDEEQQQVDEWQNDTNVPIATDVDLPSSVGIAVVDALTAEVLHGDDEENIDATLNDAMRGQGIKHSSLKMGSLALIAVLSICCAVAFPTAKLVSSKKDAKAVAPPQPQEVDADGSVKAQQLQFVRELALTMSSEEDLNDHDSPQYLALEFLVSHHEVVATDLSSVSFKRPPQAEYMIAERYMMSVLYYALGGSEWTRTDDFVTFTFTCDWSDMVECNEGLRVSGLFFGEFSVLATEMNTCLWFKDPSTVILTLSSLSPDNNNLRGSIPSEIKYFRNLKHLSFEGNPGLVGTVPQGIATMSSLKNMSLQGTSVTGSIDFLCKESGGAELEADLGGVECECCTCCT